MNTSQQATGRDVSRDENYPFRCIVWELRWDEWRVAEIFEWETWAGAVMAGNGAIEEFAPGVTAMHYYVGEVAHG